jgi:predicted nucleic acid-binding protein
MPKEAATALDDLFHMPIVTIHRPDIYLQSLDFAHRLGHAKAYDAQFLAVAQMQGCPIVTLDRGLYQGARTLGLEARMLI